MQTAEAPGVLLVDFHGISTVAVVEDDFASSIVYQSA
jgi:hypothetical protein